MVFLLFVFLSYIVNRILNNLTLVICLVFAFEEFAIKLHSLFVKTPSLWIALLGHIHPLLSRSKSSTSSFVQNKCLHLTNQFLKRLCLHVSNISFYKARKSRILQQRDQIRGHQNNFTKMKSNPRLQEKFYKNETKSEAASKDFTTKRSNPRLQERRGCCRNLKSNLKLKLESALACLSLQTQDPTKHKKWTTTP